MAPIEGVDDEDPTSIFANPIVKELRTIDDEYLNLEREYQKKITEVQKDYDRMQSHLLDKRKSILVTPDGDKGKTGTPALKNFWLQCFQNHPDIHETIFEADHDVLSYLQDVTKEDLEDETGLNQAGFKLIFKFEENPYFRNAELTKEYHTKESSPFVHDLDVHEIVCNEIDWHSGKDVNVTCELKKKKKKKAKAKADKGEMEKVPIPSFFRIFFTNMKKGDDPPEDLVKFQKDGEDDEDSDDDDDEEIMDMLMDDDYNKGVALRESVIPFAVRWYTGEACPDADDDSDDESESDEGGDKSKKAENIFDAGAPKDGKEAVKEECKQQ